MTKNHKDLHKELKFFINSTLLPYINKVREYNSPYNAMFSINGLNNYFIVEAEEIGVSTFIIFGSCGLFILVNDNNKLINLEIIKGEENITLFNNKEPLNNDTNAIYKFLKTHNNEYPEEQMKEKIKDF